MKNCINISLLLIISISVNAQQGDRNSLKWALAHATSDSARWEKCIRLTYLYADSELDSAFYYANTGLLLARQNNKRINEAAMLDW